jgi:ribonuclease E
MPVTADENRRIEVFERELWRIAVEHLDYGEQVQWAALAGARVAPTGWRRARAMLHFDQGGELKRTFLTTAVERNKNPQLRLKALQEIAAGRDAEAFDRALDYVETWPRDDKREGVKVVLQALAEKKIGRRDQANNWIWRCANMTREVHEEYAVQRWPETKRLLGLLVNSSGGAHARNARRLVHAARQQDRRLSAALLAAALPHTAEAGEVVNGARTRMSRKPAALARELLRNFPKGKGKAKRRRKKKAGGAPDGAAPELVGAETAATAPGGEETTKPRRSRRRRPVDADPEATPRTGRSRRRKPAEPVVAEAPEPAVAEPEAPLPAAAEAESPKPTRAKVALESPADEAPQPAAATAEEAPKPVRARRAKAAPESPAESSADEAPKPARARRTKAAAESAAAPKPARTRRTKAADNGVPNPLEEASERVKAAVREAAGRPAGDEAA